MATMKATLRLKSFAAMCSRSVAVVAAFALLSVSAGAACDKYSRGVAWGVVSIDGLQEASGIAASRRNPGVLWVHNDGSSGAVHAVGVNGAHLATFFLGRAVSDTEDIAVGPGPVAGVSYLYVGDSGGKRRDVQILRIPEPIVDPGRTGSPISTFFSGVDAFTVSYPDGKHDAESLMVDPSSREVFIVTKQGGGARVYRANLNNVFPGSQVQWGFVTSLPFANASGGDISADGTQIVLRREDFVQTWERFNGEWIGTTLSRSGTGIPVIGPPLEPNGEGIALLPNGAGYVTISEGANPVLYFFEAQCPSRPQITVGLRNRTAVAGRKVTLGVRATGYPAPTYRWRLNGSIIPGETRRLLVLPNVSFSDEGEYMVTAINPSGKMASRGTLTVLP